MRRVLCQAAVAADARDGTELTSRLPFALESTLIAPGAGGDAPRSAAI
jgi:hypothetical protein